MLHDLLNRLRSILRRHKVEDELDAELRFHLEHQTAKLASTGLSVAAAAREARMRLGGLEQAKENCRDAHGLLWWSEAVQNLRYARRTLVRSPGFTAVAVLTMTLGVGVNTALFTIMDAVLFRPVPIAHPENFYTIQRGRLTSSDLRMLQQNARTVRELVASRWIMPTLEDSGQLSPGNQVSANYFETVRIHALIGRVFTVASNDPAESIVISEYFWDDHFHRDPSVIGRTLVLDGRRYTIIGVTEPGFIDTIPIVSNFWTLLPGGPAAASDPVTIEGRLAPGVSMMQAEEELTTLLTREHPDASGARPYPAKLQARGTFIPLDKAEIAITALLAACAGMVLLIGCANLANLLLARAAGRQREIAIRLSLGGTRARVVRQLLTESALIALLGGAASLLASSWILPVAARAIQARLPQNAGVWVLHLTPGLTVFAWTLATCAVASLLFGLAPAFTATRTGVAEALKDGGGQGLHWSRSRLRSALVIVQVALCLVLLINAGLLARSLRNARTADPGFETDHVIVVQYAAPKRVPPALLLRQLSVNPEVLASAAAIRAPLVGNDTEPTLRMPINRVTEGFFATLGIPLVRGRGFTAQEISGDLPVMVISEGAARRLFPGQEAVGRVLKTDRPRTVVGIARDTRSVRLTQIDPAYIYEPLAPGDLDHGAQLLLRTRREAAMLEGSVRRDVVRVLNSDVPVFALGFAIYFQRLPAQAGAIVATVLGSLALVLATVGIYGVISYVVSQRTREVGIRMALGAGRGEVVRMIVRQGMGLVAIGLALGAAGAVPLSFLLRAVLYGVQPLDPLTYLAVPFALAGVALLAMANPTWRASRVEPVNALRHE
jgi:predicted permease